MGIGKQPKRVQLHSFAIKHFEKLGEATIRKNGRSRTWQNWCYVIDKWPFLIRL